MPPLRISVGGYLRIIKNTSSDEKPAKVRKSISQQKSGGAASSTQSQKTSQKAAAAVLSVRVKPKILRIIWKSFCSVLYLIFHQPQIAQRDKVQLSKCKEQPVWLPLIFLLPELGLRFYLCQVSTVVKTPQRAEAWKQKSLNLLQQLVSGLLCTEEPKANVSDFAGNLVFRQVLWNILRPGWDSRISHSRRSYKVNIPEQLYFIYRIMHSPQVVPKNVFSFEPTEEKPDSEPNAERPRSLESETERERLRREAQEHRRRVADVSSSSVSVWRPRLHVLGRMGFYQLSLFSHS